MWVRIPVRVIMQGRSRSQPMSRELVRIIREASRADQAGVGVSDHLEMISARQAKEIEFYLRACALRLRH